MDLIWRNWLYWWNYKYADWIQRIATDWQRVRITGDLDKRDNALDEDCGKLEWKLTESPSEEKWRIDNCAKKMTNDPEDGKNLTTRWTNGHSGHRLEPCRLMELDSDSWILKVATPCACNWVASAIGKAHIPKWKVLTAITAYEDICGSRRSWVT